MLFSALLTVACLVFVSSGQTTSANNSMNDTQELPTSAISYPSAVVNADPTMSQTRQTPPAIQSSAEPTVIAAPETSSAAPVATSAPVGGSVVATIVPFTMTMATSASPVATSESPMVTPVTTILPSVTSIPPVTTSIPPVTTSIPPVTTSIPPVTTSTPPIMTSIPPVATSTPPVTTSTPPVTTSIPPVTTSIPFATTSIPPVTTNIPSVTSIVPTTTTTMVNIPPIITNTPPITASTSVAPATNSISPTTISMPAAKLSSSLYILSQSSLHEVLAASSSQIQTTLPSSAAPSQTMAYIYPPSIHTQGSTTDITPWQVSVAILAVLTGILLLTTVTLSIALCVAICRFRARNLTYTIKNPEAKESKYWIETKSSPSENKASSPVRAEDEHKDKVWYAENATAFPVFPMVHLAATKDPADSSPSVQTFRLARAYRQSPGSSAPSRSQATAENTPAVPVLASAPSNKKETTSDGASNKTTDGAVVVGGEEAVGRAILIPTTPTLESDLGKGKKRRPPPLKPIGAVSAEPQEGTYSKQGGSSSHNPTTPGSCSVHKGQVYSGPDPRAELMKEYSAMLQGKQNTT